MSKSKFALLVVVPEADGGAWDYVCCDFSIFFPGSRLSLRVILRVWR